MSDPHLFHFSEDPTIQIFEPRPVRVAAERPPGQDWLNGPLVWAIDAWHQPMYYFPRDCPRVLLWKTPATTAADLDHWWRGDRARLMQAHVEAAWLERLRTTPIYRYVFAPDDFEPLADAGMCVARTAVRPLALEPVGDLLAAMSRADVELQVMDDLLPLKGVWESSVYASGIRLRNAAGWTEPVWPQGRPRIALRTERLTLRPFEIGDAERLVEIVSNWNVARMLRLLPWPLSLENQRAWLATHAPEWRAGIAYRFAIIREGRLIGCADLDEVEGGQCEIGYWLEEGAWGRGLASEAAGAVIDFAARSLGLTRLKSGHAADNPASGHVLEKLGFVPIDEVSVWSNPRQCEIRLVRYARKLA
ncbi:MAG TPA: GNAT family N-acetyltransferase [Caulobacteraceae bacterium]|nr:GNAT family N-acetyltransferase [Caulobacteraceae bacterium]